MPGHLNDEGYGPESSGSAGSDGGGVDTGDHDGDEQYGSDTDDSSSPSNDNSPGHPANAPTGSTGSTGPGAGGPSVGSGGGGVDTGDHDGDEQYGSDTDDSSSPSNDNSPGHPANAPTGSTGSTGPGAGGPSVGNDGGGVDTGDHDGDEQYGSDTDDSSSPSNDNSPGHPANAPTGSTGSTGPGAGGPSVGNDGGGVDTGDHDGDEQYGSDAGSSSSPSNQTSPGHPANAPTDSRRRPSNENSPGHPANAPTGNTGPGAGGPSVGINHLLEAGVPTVSRVTPDNAGDAWASHKSIVDEALAVLEQGGTPEQLAAAAASVEQIAAAWRGSGVTAKDGLLMADHLDKMVKTLSVASDNRTYRGTVTPDNAAVAWAEHRPVIDQAVAILAAGGTPAELDAAAAQVAKIAAAWRGSGVTADDGTPMTNHLDGLVQSLSESSEITQSNYDQRAEFERVFREITKREPSGDLAKDADILSRYGENALTDMGYAGEVQAFEKLFREVTKREPSDDLAKDADVLSRYGENALTDMGYAGEVQAFEKLFREVTKREPSGDLAKDADILSRYGENALTDMSYAAEVQAFEKLFREVTKREPSGDLVKDADILSCYGENALTDGDFAMGLTSEPSDLVETWGGKEAVYITSDKQPTDDESEAAFRIVTQEDGTPLVESIDRHDPTNPWDVRSRYDEEGKRYTSTGLHPGRVLGASDQNQAAAEIVDQNMVGRHIDQWGTIELPDQNRATTRHAGGPRGRGTTTEVEIRGVPQEYIAGWDEKGEPILAPGWQEAVVPLSLNRSRIEGLNTDNTYQTGDPTLWARAKPWVSVVPGASTLIKLNDIQHPGSADGSQITGREWREFGAEALVDSVYLVGWPYGAVNLARGVGTAAAKGGLKAAGKQTLHMARPDRLAKTVLWEPSLPNVSRIVGKQGVNTVKNLRNPLTSIGTKGKGTLKGLASETGEELLVEYPFEVAAPHLFGVADPAKPLFTGDWSDPLSIRPGSGLIPSRDDALWMGGSVGVFGVLEGVGGRRFSPGGDVAIPTFEGPQSAGRRDFGDGGQHSPGGTRWQPSGEMRRHHLPHEPSAGFHEGGLSTPGRPVGNP